MSRGKLRRMGQAARRGLGHGEVERGLAGGQGDGGVQPGVDQQGEDQREGDGEEDVEGALAQGAQGNRVKESCDD